jgi:hypothetical protein
MLQVLGLMFALTLLVAFTAAPMMLLKLVSEYIGKLVNMFCRMIVKVVYGVDCRDFQRSRY